MCHYITSTNVSFLENISFFSPWLSPSPFITHVFAPPTLGFLLTSSSLNSSLPSTIYENRRVMALIMLPLFGDLPSICLTNPSIPMDNLLAPYPMPLRDQQHHLACLLTIFTFALPYEGVVALVPIMIRLIFFPMIAFIAPFKHLPYTWPQYFYLKPSHI